MKTNKAKYDKAYGKATVAHRVKRNQARAIMKEKLEERYGEARAAQMMKGKDVAHIKPVSKGGTNAPSNLKLQPRSVNRGRKGEGARKAGSRVKTVRVKR
jgi:hypothetical protein